MTTLYPISVDVKVHITDGKQVGVVTFTMGLHKLPTEANMPEVLEKVTAALPDGFRLMSRHESTMYFLREEKGYRGPNLALPSLEEGEAWHDPSAENTFSDIGDEPECEDEF